MRSNSIAMKLLPALGLLTAMGPMSIDMYLPALPAISEGFSAPAAAAQATLSVFFLGFAVGQLLYGPLSDRFGRRPILFVALSGYVLISAACAMATSIEELIALRFFQALSGGAGAVMSRAIARDVSSGEEAARLMSLVMMVMALAPLLAPVIGGYVLILSDWRMIFWVLTLFGIAVLLVLYFRVPETLKAEHRQSLSPGRIANAFLRVLRHKQAMGNILGSSFAFSGMFAYFAGSPFVYIRFFGLPEEYYGYFFGFNVLGLLVTSYLNARMVSRTGTWPLLLTGLLISCLAGLSLLFFSTWNGGSFIGIVLSIFFYIAALNMIGPNAVARALQNFPDIAGTASSVFGLLQFGLGALSGLLVGLLHDGTPFAMGLVMAGCGICALLASFLLGRD